MTVVFEMLYDEWSAVQAISLDEMFIAKVIGLQTNCIINNFRKS